MSRTKRAPESFHAVRDLVEHCLATYPAPLRVSGLLNRVSQDGFTRSLGRQVIDYLVGKEFAEYVIIEGHICIKPAALEQEGGEV